MASRNTTTPYQTHGHRIAGLPNTFTSVPQPSTPYSNITFSERKPAFQFNEDEQNGSGHAWMTTPFGPLGSGDYPQDLDPQYRAWFDNWSNSPEAMLRRYSDEKRRLQDASDKDLTGMSHYEGMSYNVLPKVETRPNQPPFHPRNILGANLFQQPRVPNHFQGATQFLPLTNIPQLNNVHGNIFISGLNNGNVKNEYTNNGYVTNKYIHNGYVDNGYGNHTATATTDSGTVQQQPQQPQQPPYPAPSSGRLPTFDNSLQAYRPPQNDTLGQRSPVLEDRIPGPTRKIKTKGKQTTEDTSRKQPRTPRPAVSNRAQPAASGPTQAPSFTNLPHAVAAPLPLMIAPGIPQPAERLVANSSVDTRARDPNQIYGNQIADRPPHKVMPPRNIDISILEICTFFPSWFLLPEVAMRAQANGWDRKQLAKAHLNATGTLYSVTDEEFHRAQNRIQKHFSYGGKAMFHIPAGRENPWCKAYVVNSAFPKDNLTAVNWRFKSDHLRSKKQDQWGHISLKDIYSHVHPNSWPQGADRMILTQCLEYAYNNQHLDLDTSHLSWIMHTQNLVQGPYQTSQHDKDAHTRFKAAVADR